MRRTEVLLGVAPTLALLVQIALWAVLEGVVTVTCGHLYERPQNQTALEHQAAAYRCR